MGNWNTSGREGARIETRNADKAFILSYLNAAGLADVRIREPPQCGWGPAVRAFVAARDRKPTDLFVLSVAGEREGDIVKDLMHMCFVKCFPASIPSGICFFGTGNQPMEARLDAVRHVPRALRYPDEFLADCQQRCKWKGAYCYYLRADDSREELFNVAFMDGIPRETDVRVINPHSIVRVCITGFGTSDDWNKEVERSGLERFGVS